MKRPLLLLPLLLLLPACRSSGITFVVEPELEEVVQDFLSFIPSEDLHLESSADPLSELGEGQVAVLSRDDCEECYSLEARDQAVVIRGGSPLGYQYGISDLLERAGFRFYHPHHTLVPGLPQLPERIQDSGETHAPERSHRALHLHTLHPTDAHLDLWIPSEAGRARASAILDWMVKNRANHIQWMALDDITSDDTRHAAWLAHTRGIQEQARLRGLTTGLGVELYGSGNLQRAYDLLDNPGEEAEDAEILSERLSRVMEGLEWDTINLSFGEFFGEDPERFIRDIDSVQASISALDPETHMTAWVHIGDDVRVEYKGEDLLYYFLVKYANPSITRSVHTVMYYNLFDDAGGAYHHQDFSEHRSFLLEELERGHPVEYYPESSYWVAFDVSVPQFLPLYVISRWTDLAGLDAETQALGIEPLDAHTLFTTAWEWGYWMHDLATLRMCWELPDHWKSSFDFMFQPLGGEGLLLSGVVADLAQLQHDALIVGRLGAWIAGVDGAMDAGYLLDIVSQPRRSSLKEVSTADAETRASIEAEVLDPLRDFSLGLDALRARAQAIPMEGPWIAEIRDGIEVDLARARFVEATYRAVIAWAEGQDPAAHVQDADEALETAREIVARRHAALHDPEPGRLLVEGSNSTIYQYGYLRWAHELCYWERERIQLGNITGGLDEAVPACLF